MESAKCFRVTRQTPAAAVDHLPLLAIRPPEMERANLRCSSVLVVRHANVLLSSRRLKYIHLAAATLS